MLIAWCDSDWNGDEDDLKVHQAMLFYLLQKQSVCVCVCLRRFWIIVVCGNTFVL